MPEPTAPVVGGLLVEGSQLAGTDVAPPGVASATCRDCGNWPLSGA
jgi:hypothetical protein